MKYDDPEWDLVEGQEFENELMMQHANRVKEQGEKCPKCGQERGFDITGLKGGCDGEVTELHCPNCDEYFDPRKPRRVE